MEVFLVLVLLFGAFSLGAQSSETDRNAVGEAAVTPGANDREENLVRKESAGDPISVPALPCRYGPGVVVQRDLRVPSSGSSRGRTGNQCSDCECPDE